MGSLSKDKIVNKRFLYYSVSHIIMLIVMLPYLVIVEKLELFTIVPIITVIIFTILIIKFFKISIGKKSITTNEAWFYDFYMKGFILYVVLICVISILKIIQ